jgi:hypothetical protein
MSTPSSAKSIYRLALSFDTAVALMQNTFANHRNVGRLIFPLSVCSAFALELYLKCLIVIEGQAAPRTHDLAALFAQLSADAQADIKRRYNEYRAGLPDGFPINHDIEDALKKSARAFEKLRYVYEGRLNEGDGWACHQVMVAVRDRIDSLHPGWKIGW